MNTAPERKENFFVHLLKFKQEMRACIQDGANPSSMKEIADRYGFEFAKPL